jgi:hypothetical protein
MEAPDPPMDPTAAGDEMKVAMASLSYSSNESPMDISLSAGTGTVGEEKKTADEERVGRSPISSPRPQNHYSNCLTIDDFVGRVIGNTVIEAVSCPCCQQAFDEENKTMNEPVHIARSRGSLISHQSDDEDEDDEELLIEEDMLPGSLGPGVQYHPRNVLVQGWLHKKGTGKDWLGSRSWKARYARLITAKVDGYSCDVPLLQIYWHSSTPLPSTVILLESTVVMAHDLDDKDLWNSYRFEIRHATTRENATIPVTRLFAAPKKGRDAWMYAISEALLAYAKEKDYVKKTAVLDSLDSIGCIRSPKSPPKPGRPLSPVYDEVWTGDRFVKVEMRALNPSSSPSPPERLRSSRSPSPPNSPRLPRPTTGRAAIRRPLPRPGRPANDRVPAA